MNTKIKKLILGMTEKLESDKKAQAKKLKRIKRKSEELAARISEFEDAEDLLTSI